MEDDEQNVFFKMLVQYTCQTNDDCYCFAAVCDRSVLHFDFLL